MPVQDNVTPHPASFYDEQIRNTIPFYDIFHEETLRIIRAAVPEPEFWLDTGCGTGSLVKKAHGIFPQTTFLLADPSSDMLRIAQEKLKGLSRVQFLSPTGTQALQLNHPADVVTAIQAHHYLTGHDRRIATQVCYNNLKPGGIFVTFENIRPLTEHGISLGKQIWAEFQISRGKDGESVRKHLARFDSEYFPITVEDHLSLLRECRFKTVELLWYSTMQAGFYGIK